MRVVSQGGWIYYIEKTSIQLEDDRCGKWMYFFSDKEFVSHLCLEAVNNGIVSEAKHSDQSNGVACFYLNGDDFEGHKRVIGFFLDHNLIRKTKTGKLYNIAFKYDNQTRDGEYGEGFVSEIKLEQFLDLQTGEWK